MCSKLGIEIIIYIKAFVTGLCTFLIGLLGGWDVALKVLMVLTFLDILTGVMAGIYQKKLSSKIGSKGFLKKNSIYIVVAISCLLDEMFGTYMLRSGTIGFYIGIEGLSILENLGIMHIPLPSFVKDILLQLKQKNKDVKIDE